MKKLIVVIFMLGLIGLALVGCAVYQTAVTSITPTPTPAPILATETAVLQATTTSPPATKGVDVPPLEESMKSYQTMTMIDGTDVQYAVILPIGYKSGGEYPILLALPPGPQTRDMVEAGLGGYWEEPAKTRGWIVISPIAPQGKLFFQGSERIMPEFLTRIADIYNLEGGQFHLAGVSNGGISAFRIAVNQPGLFRSILVVPGMPGSEEDFAKLETISHIPLAMFVGEHDTAWLARMEATEEELARLEAELFLEVVPNEGHVIQSLGGERFFDFFEDHR